MPDHDYDVAIVGGGPGGYVAAIRARQLGLRTALVEQAELGGVCLNWGCIPAKVLLHSAGVAETARGGAALGVHAEGVRLDLGEAVDHSRDVVDQMVRGVESLLAHNGVDVIRASARFVDAHTLALSAGGRSLTAGAVIVATGARPRSPWPVDGVRVLTSREALEHRAPPRTLAILGGGCVGVEFADVFAAAGTQVTLVEHSSRLLDEMGDEAGRALERAYRARGIEIHTGTRAHELRVGDDGVTVTLEAADGGTSEIAAECVLVALGIQPNTRDCGLEEIGVTLNERGFIVTDELGRTSAEGVWAIGDVTGRMPLAHVASAQGVAAVEAIAGLDPAPLALERVPRVVYSHPEVAAIGLTEAQARERGRDAQVARFPMRASGRALTTGETDGFVQLVADATTRELLGAQIVGVRASELIAEVALGQVLETTPLEIIATVHAHPTFAEATREAALMLEGRGVHFFSAPPAARATGASAEPAPQP